MNKIKKNNVRIIKRVEKLLSVLILSVSFIILRCGKGKEEVKINVTEFKSPQDVASRLSANIDTIMGYIGITEDTRTSDILYIGIGRRCSDLERIKCSEGSIVKLDCKEGEESGKEWRKLDVTYNQCKVTGEKESYKIIDGTLKINSETSRSEQKSSTKDVSKTNKKILYKYEADGEIKVTTSYKGDLKTTKTKLSKFKIESEANDEEIVYLTTSTGTAKEVKKLLASGSASDISKEYSFYDFKIVEESNYSFPTNPYPKRLTPDVMKMEISGAYSINDFSSPNSCTSGTFKFETLESLKLKKEDSSDESTCPMVAGKLKVNNSTIEFLPNMAIITVGDQKINYKCEELFKLCR
jgi:hypothetical protein